MTRLDQILSTKVEEVAASRLAVSAVELAHRARDAQPPRGFLRALQAAEGVALVAEVKRASPSRGMIREGLDPAELAHAYARAGASCLSVLTDRRFFLGAPEHLRLARDAGGLPTLRKDFVVDEYQIVESRSLGADAILLIVAALDGARLEEFSAAARAWGMDVLVEVHTAEEAERALAVGAELVGVNNRNLSDFETSLEVSECLIPRLAPHAFVISESALETVEDVARVRAAGARGVLIGTAFCAAENVEAKVREVMGW